MNHPICEHCGLEIPPTDPNIGGICDDCHNRFMDAWITEELACDDDAWIDDLAEELANDDDRDRDRDDRTNADNPH